MWCTLATGFCSSISSSFYTFTFLSLYLLFLLRLPFAHLANPVKFVLLKVNALWFRTFLFCHFIFLQLFLLSSITFIIFACTPPGFIAPFCTCNVCSRSRSLHFYSSVSAPHLLSFILPSLLYLILFLSLSALCNYSDVLPSLLAPFSSLGEAGRASYHLYLRVMFFVIPKRGFPAPSGPPPEPWV